MRRMKVGILILVLLCAACVSLPGLPPTATMTIQSPPAVPPPAFQNWRFVEQRPSDQMELPVIVYAIKLTGQESLLISSFTADEAERLNEAGITIQVRDDLDAAGLTSKYELGTIGQVSFLALRFAPRSIGVSELYLHIDQGVQDSNPVDRLIARFSDPPESSTLHGRRTYGLNASQTYEQKGYRISFVGWFGPPSSVVFFTPESPAGATITDQATLEIIDVSSSQTTYLYIQFLSNGEIRGEVVR